MISDEALAFVDLMRKDDLDRRAGNVSRATNADERGEPSHEDVVEQSLQEPQSESGESAESLPVFQETNEDSLPATPVSEVALGAEPLQAASEQFDLADAVTATQEDGQPSEPSQALQDTGDDAVLDALFSQPEQIRLDSQASQVVSELSEQAEPSNPATEQGEDARAAVGDSEETSPAIPAVFEQQSGEQSLPSVPVQEQGEDAVGSNSEQQDRQLLSSEAAELFSESGAQADTNAALAEEGVRITSIGNLSGETTILQPESMPDFEAMLRSFDRDYRPPDPPAGDDIQIPPPPDLSDSEPMQSSTEFAERMVAGMSDEYLAGNRRKA